MGKKETTRVRRTFTPQFKRDAVKLVNEGKTVSEVARDLGIARSLLQRWRDRAAGEGVDAVEASAKAFLHALAQLNGMPLIGPRRKRSLNCLSTRRLWGLTSLFAGGMP